MCDPVSVSGMFLTWRWCTFDFRYRVWGVQSPYGLWTCDPRHSIWEVGSAWVMWTFDPKCRVWGEGYEDWMCDSRCMV